MINNILSHKPLIEEVLPHFYRVEVPLPDSPLKSINSYFIKADKRNLIIDTGMDRKVCREALEAAVRITGIQLGQTDWFITHYHADHMGLVTAFVVKDCKVYVGLHEAEKIHSEPLTKWAVENTTFASSYGFPEDVAKKMIYIMSRMKNFHAGLPELTCLLDGDRLNVGDYHFQCIETPGHSCGHMCLYEVKQQILVSGDHILGDITPNISSRYDERNPLAEYLSSLDKVASLNVRLVLPGHRKPLTDLKGRIGELKHHHQVRTEEVLNILKSGDLNAFQIASHMTWDMSYETIEEFPIFSQWFAFSEALAHLQYLEGLGRVRCIRKAGNQIVYTLV